MYLNGKQPIAVTKGGIAVNAAFKLIHDYCWDVIADTAPTSDYNVGVRAQAKNIINLIVEQQQEQEDGNAAQSRKISHMDNRN